MVFRLAERIFVLVLLLSSMTVVDALTRPAYSSGHDPDVLSTDVPLPTVIIESGVYAFGAILVLSRWRRVVKAMQRVWPLTLLMLLAPISLAWSNAPALTARRSIFLTGTTLLGIYLGERFSITQMLRWVTQALCVVIAASILMFLVSPSSVIDYGYGDAAWKGAAFNKNIFGWYMSLAFAALLLVRFRHLRWTRYLFLCAAAVLLFLSRSATSLVGCFLGVSVMPLWRVMRTDTRTRRLIYSLVIAGAGAAIYLVVAGQELLFQILGRDSTFTGRTELWALVLPAIQKHPILGYGYGAFWSGMNREVLDIYIATKWLPMGAHNGYLELCLAFGLLGLPLLFLLFWRSLRMATEYMKSSDEWSGVWPMTYLLMFMFHNLFESHLLETRSLEFLLFATITTSLAREHARTELPSARYQFGNRERPVYSFVER